MSIICKHTTDMICGAISKCSPYRAEEVEQVYKFTNSIDKTIQLLDIMAEFNCSKEDAGLILQDKRSPYYCSAGKMDCENLYFDKEGFFCKFADGCCTGRGHLPEQYKYISAYEACPWPSKQRTRERFNLFSNFTTFWETLKRESSCISLGQYSCREGTIGTNKEAVIRTIKTLRE
jgi:hypothetical protein